ncbi:UDP-N-acetylglucosamine 2-epimerase [Candidatus Arthromitus sp. SFB-mouse-NL]|uniref:non-hydrolyzing UDP-N-acetylglucosamine 2-epimerase n=1 Tax=Candidatus Arthromitus sp. SFB-mouse-NL TaxID=1508644 RepID=UPI00049A94A9|nr:UDP-N-acetylglucosamine 2-epimerase (non-hydrolyzing) [Candidatus Arthromitus sp. SFB-mouse-NL]AID45247.1 UDP-N-acetylglucosamine 2-epimerase [Candidatus Arthromitus sp. SFB-mouse-NL]
MSIKVISVFGTRPEAIKMVPLIKELQNNKNFENIVCVTAQHREMLDDVLNKFNIIPDYDLNLMREKQTLPTLTTSIMINLEKIYLEEKPKVVLVHGDTTTTFCSSLGAFYQKIDIGHVEAGLRSNDLYFPFPEEANRKLTGVLAKYHFAPTNLSKNNLLKEGVNEKNIYVVGNTVIDTMKYTISNNYIFRNKILRDMDFSRKVIVVTAHRRESWGKPIINICNVVKKISEEYEDIKIVFLTHLNPIVRDTVNSILNGISNVYILDPIDIYDSHNLLSRCFFVMTDSGGIQEEAPHLGKVVLVLRNETEREEMIEEGMIKLVGTDRDRIYKFAKELIDNGIEDKVISNVYGDGNTSKRIVSILEKNYLGNN